MKDEGGRMKKTCIEFLLPPSSFLLRSGLVMDLSSVHKGVHKLRRKKRVGRGIGSGHGKTATRGAKGQWASAGAKKPTALFEGGQMQLFRRIPKRGFSHATWDKHFLVVNVGDIDKVFDEGATVDPDALKKVGLAKGPSDGVRILGNGELTKKLIIKAHHFSKSAAEKITAKGGTTEIIPPPKKPVKNKMRPRPAKEQGT
jgi:large subunit ribosomal protein L15